MNDLRQAAQQALEALEQYKGVVVTHHDPESFRRMEVDSGQAARAAIAALRAALAEPDYWQEEARRYAGNADYWRKRYKALAEPEQEPVAYLHNETELLRLARRANSGDFEPNHWTPLYTAPTPCKPLTDEEIEDLYFDGFSISKLKDFARAIEDAHGITGETK